jgi:DNA mismatch repair ATPase MutS
VKTARNALLAGVLASAAVLTGCPDQPKTLDAQSLKAEVQNAEQLSRECSLVLELRTSGKLTETFRTVHELYLLKQFEDLKKTADRAKADSSIQSAFAEYKQKLQTLESAVRAMSSEPHKEAFEGVTNDLEALGKKL